MYNELKVHPRTDHKGPEWVGGQRHAPRRFKPRKDPVPNV